MEEEEQELSYKLRGEKSLPSAILLSKWSPRMDVIALALEDGSVRYGYTYHAHFGGVAT